MHIISSKKVKVEESGVAGWWTKETECNSLVLLVKIGKEKVWAVKESQLD